MLHLQSDPSKGGDMGPVKLEFQDLDNVLDLMSLSAS
jgi:hypothetical protein